MSQGSIEQGRWLCLVPLGRSTLLLLTRSIDNSEIKHCTYLEFLLPLGSRSLYRVLHVLSDLPRSGCPFRGDRGLATCVVGPDCRPQAVLLKNMSTIAVTCFSISSFAKISSGLPISASLGFFNSTTATATACTICYVEYIV